MTRRLRRGKEEKEGVLVHFISPFPVSLPWAGQMRLRGAAVAARAILRGESVCCHGTRARIIEYNFIAWVEQCQVI